MYEHCWGETRISRLLIDWEVETPRLGGLRTAAQMRATADKFPGWFVKALRRLGALEPLAPVNCVVKDKTRLIEGGEKVSFHFIFSIAGFPKGSHMMAALRVIDPHLGWLKACAEKKSFTEHLDHPVIGVDWRTLGGSHGFSTPLSKKRESDPDPVVTKRLTLLADKEDEQALVFEVGSTGARRALYQASYTTPEAATVGYCPEFVAQDVVCVDLPGGVEPPHDGHRAAGKAGRTAEGREDHPIRPRGQEHPAPVGRVSV